MARSAATQKRILDAYKILLAEKGLDELSVEDIIRESKLARSTFYRYYRDKYEPIQDLLAEVFGHFYLEPENCRNTGDLLYRTALNIIQNRPYLSAIFRFKGQNSCFELIRCVAGNYQSTLQKDPTFSPFHEQLHKGYTYATLYLIYDWIIGDMRSCFDANLFASAIYELCPQSLRDIYGWEKTKKNIQFSLIKHIEEIPLAGIFLFCLLGQCPKWHGGYRNA